MSSLKVAILMLIALCYNSQIHCAPRISLKEYDFSNQQLVIGKHHIDKTRWIYALCEMSSDRRRATCTLELQANAFDTTKPTAFCNVTLSTQFSNGKLDILGVDLWDKDKAIFTWQDLKKNRLRRASITIQTVNMRRNCATSVQTLMVDNREDMKTQVFIIPFASKYVVLFKDTKLLRTSFYKINVYEDGRSSKAERWFRSNDLIHAVEPFEYLSKMLLITIENSDDEIRVRYYILDETGKTEVLSSASIHAVGWSNSNGITSFCSKYFCLYTNQEDKIASDMTLHMEPQKYLTLYNLPSGGHLAVICNLDLNGMYRIIKIGINGLQESFYVLSDLNCSDDFQYLTAQFYKESDTEYCLSLFHEQYRYEGWFMFRKYCFSLENLL